MRVVNICQQHARTCDTEAVSAVSHTTALSSALGATIRLRFKRGNVALQSPWLRPGAYRFVGVGACSGRIEKAEVSHLFTASNSAAYNGAMAARAFASLSPLMPSSEAGPAAPTSCRFQARPETGFYNAAQQQQPPRMGDGTFGQRSEAIVLWTGGGGA